MSPILSEQYTCTTCGHVRQPGDPPLEKGLVGYFRTGKCKAEKGYPKRVFKRTDAGPRDLPAGEAAKENGIAKANQTASFDHWAPRADQAIAGLALQRVEFTSEDVTAIAGLPTRGSNSAVGARMNAAARRGIIRWTGRMAKAERPNQHAALLKVWRGA